MKNQRRVYQTGMPSEGVEYLTAEGNRKLFQEYQETQNPEIKEQLILKNLGLPRKIAENEARKHNIHMRDLNDFLEDLVGEGVLGLVEAVNNYDLERGVDFSTYACPYIEGSIKNAINRRYRFMKAPTTKGSWPKFLHEGIPYLEQCEKEHEEPDLEKLAKMCNAKMSSIKAYIDHHNSRRVPTIDKEESMERRRGNSTCIDLSNYAIEEDKSNSNHSETTQKISVLLSSLLSEREKEIVRLYFGIGYVSPKSLNDIGKQLNLSGQTIRTEKNKALERVKAYIATSHSLKGGLS